ncbi:hypothetical protein [Acinetobacter lactucae]|uniref:hypothetical protein n=1 Tax=Acinetobacter lactucae TaxID=1785128 RepID=UPI00237B4BAF|nr:hypothetical protein [Acinetobacter lactucae]MDD9317889.1 hypothetical protein [Acinetobacter lactucae]
MDKSKIEYLEFYKSELGNGKHCTKSFGLAVWQHQQAKVNTLTQKLSVTLGDLDVANKNLRDRFSAFQLVRSEADDLKKRMVSALAIAEELLQSMEWYKVGERLEKILKGPEPNTFKAGDKVVFDNTKQYCAALPNHMMEYVDIHPEWPQDRLVLIDGVLNEVSYKAIRHATPEEIAAGRRIDGVEN